MANADRIGRRPAAESLYAAGFATFLLGVVAGIEATATGRWTSWIGWVSAGGVALAGALIVGAELRDGSPRREVLAVAMLFGGMAGFPGILVVRVGRGTRRTLLLVALGVVFLGTVLGQLETDDGRLAVDWGGLRETYLNPANVSLVVAMLVVWGTFEYLGRSVTGPGAGTFLLAFFAVAAVVRVGIWAGRRLVPGAVRNADGDAPDARPDRDLPGWIADLADRAGESPGEFSADEVDRLVGALDHEDPAVRSEAARALGRVGSTDPERVADAVGPLAEALDDELPVRKAAAAALMYVGQGDAELLTGVVDRLVDALDDGDPRVRRPVAGALGAVGHVDPDLVEDGVAYLLGTLDDDPDIKQVAYALGPVGSRDPSAVGGAIDPLVAALDDDDPEVRNAAATALGQVGSHDPGRVADAVDPLVAALEAGDTETRRTAALALGRIGGADPSLVADAEAALRSVADDPDPDVREAAEEAIEAVR